MAESPVFLYADDLKMFYPVNALLVTVSNDIFSYSLFFMVECKLFVYQCQQCQQAVVERYTSMSNSILTSFYHYLRH